MAIGKGGKISITTERIDDNVQIKISDTGKGIPKKDQNKIFEPFFTTQPTGEGTGLGLSISKDIIDAHSGSILVESTEGEGSTFFVKLPMKS